MEESTDGGYDALTEAENEANLSAPVSYTHLDVYKRQVPDLLPFGIETGLLRAQQG